MSDSTLYFKVTGGKVGDAISRFIELRTEQLAARKAIEKEFGARGTYGNDRGLVGLVFDKAPEGWRAIKGEPTAYRPPLGNAGKEIKNRMGKLPFAGAREFQAMVLGEDDMFRFMSGLSIHYMTFECVGEIRVLKVPKSDKPAVEQAAEQWQPPDGHCIPLKTSEYWAIKEAA